MQIDFLEHLHWAEQLIPFTKVQLVNLICMLGWLLLPHQWATGGAETIVRQENHDIVAIIETWWDDLNNRIVAMDDSKPFRREGQGRR